MPSVDDRAGLLSRVGEHVRMTGLDSLFKRVLDVGLERVHVEPCAGLDADVAKARHHRGVMRTWRIPHQERVQAGQETSRRQCCWMA
jgi:hypothetical protein